MIFRNLRTESRNSVEGVSSVVNKMREGVTIIGAKGIFPFLILLNFILSSCLYYMYFTVFASHKWAWTNMAENPGIKQ